MRRFTSPTFHHGPLDSLKNVFVALSRQTDVNDDPLDRSMMSCFYFSNIL